MKTKPSLFVIILTAIALILLLLPTHQKDEKVVAKEHLATLNPALVPVCACESAYRKDGVPQQFEKDGVTVRFGRINKLDTGMCQINQKYHLAKAQSMNLDIFTEQGNIKYANYLYETEGLAPWGWSKPCWK